jgi:hypothetical protein
MVNGGLYIVGIGAKRIVGNGVGIRIVGTSHGVAVSVGVAVREKGFGWLASCPTDFVKTPIDRPIKAIKMTTGNRYRLCFKDACEPSVGFFFMGVYPVDRGISSQEKRDTA